MYHNIFELVYNDLANAQKSITRLFPKFKQRVDAVANNGGSVLVDKGPDRWKFEVSSGTKPGVSYDVYVQWVNPEETLKELVLDPTYWKEDFSGLNMMKLAMGFMDNCDIKVYCNCPADLYWGGQYIRTRKNAKYTSPENRPPDVRNPRQFGAFCKHLQLTMDTLHAHGGTCVKWLNDYYGKLIARLQSEVIAKKFKEKGIKTKPVKIGAEEIKPFKATAQNTEEE